MTVKRVFLVTAGVFIGVPAVALFVVATVCDSALSSRFCTTGASVPLAPPAWATVTRTPAEQEAWRKRTLLANRERDAAAGHDSSDDAAYQRIIVGAGEPCDQVTRTFVAGTDKRTHATFVSVACDDGHSYQVSGSREAGSTRVLSCAVLYAVSKLRCFERLETQ